jgi:hypothetical protein
MAERVCRCEATISAIILEDYACGRPDCWRTAEVQASFDRFVGDLIRKRGDEPPNAPAVEPA